MDNSEENVTLFAAFISDILTNYEGKRGEFSQPLFDMAEGYDLSLPTNQIPIKVYNEMCAWIGHELGNANLRLLGVKIGETAFGSMKQNNLVSEKSTPLEVMKALQIVAWEMIQDTKKRGWEILDVQEKSILMRRTQTFNSMLQLGLLRGLIQKSGVSMIDVKYDKSIENGDEFDDYLITWG